jgi:pyrimidine deaminase RibD-like protein/GNAT superfamily N-acetyltransferase
MKIREISDTEIHNYHKLDKILARLCHMVIRGMKDPREGYYGMVAACVLDPDKRMVGGLNTFDDGTDTRKHAERVAIEKYLEKHGDIPAGSIIITTCSPCSEHMSERFGIACTELIDQVGVKKVYCGYIDPTQEEEHRDFNIMETENENIRDLCESFASTFTDDEEAELTEAFNQPYNAEWERGDYGTDALVKLPDGTNLSIMFNDEYDHEGNEITQVEFHRNNSQEVTGEGDAQRIFATVINAIQEFIKKNHPKRITFAADKEPGASRANLYKRLVDRFARPMGYQSETYEAGTSLHFVLTRKFGLRESKTVEYNGLALRIKKPTSYELRVEALDDWGNKVLGYVEFDIGDGKELDPQDLRVDDKYQRQGIASTMYDYVKSLGYKIVRSWDQTDAGSDFWDKHRGQDVRVWENFHDGRHPEDKGDSKRLGVPTHASISTLRKVAKQGGRKGQLAHWMANMKSGRAKAKRK